MRTLYYDFQIDGQPVLLPDAGVSIREEDVETDDTGTDESGVLHRFLLRQQVRSFALSYDTLTLEEYRYLRSLVQGKSTFQVQCKDTDGLQTELTAYCSGCSLSMHNARLGLFKGLTLEIMEC